MGDVMLDRYWSGPVTRISPEAPVPIVKVGGEEDRPGGAGNVALNSAALGARVTLLGLTGNDAAADTLTTQLTRVGIHCDFSAIAGHATITKLRVLSRHQQLLRLDFEDNFHDRDTSALTQRYATHLSACDAVILSDYGKGTLSEVAALIRAARAAGKPVLVDPKGRDFTKYRGATVITPNAAEFEAVVGPCPDEATLVGQGERLARELELTALLITRGEHGMMLLCPGQAPLSIPTQAREVFDVTGAGDTVIAVLATALAAGSTLPAAAALANLAAGLSVAKLGAATVSVPELRRALNEHGGLHRGVLSEAQLLLAVQDARAHGETLVMTNGCFDLLHAGHVSYLAQARRFGTRLIVAVNDDASVRRLKGPGRPINTLQQRMAVLAALADVDYVVPFSEDTPERLIGAVAPDVLVKGGDYVPTQIAGYDSVVARGGRVVTVDFVDGLSTTALIEKLKKG